MSHGSRREFLRTLGAATGAGALAPGVVGRELWASGDEPGEGDGAAGPAIRDGSAPRPVAIASANGLRATARAMELLRAGGDTLEAVVSGVNIVEEDPEDQTVGYGGLPNHDGVVQLDSQVWHGPTRGAGAVAALEGYRRPSRVAMAVMRYTDHVLLVGEGAAEFAAEFGFQESDLLTAASRRRWLRWRAGLSEEDDYLTPAESGEPVRDFRDPGGTGALRKDAQVDEPRPEARTAAARTAAARTAPGWRHSRDGHRPWGTIHCSAVNGKGEISAVTTTSGLFFKVPGRVGDSPLPGCGCYADNDVAAAGSTGRGEAVIKTVGAHTVVEEIRRGAHPEDACLAALRRIVDWTVEDRLLGEDGRPNFDVDFYAVDARGRHGGAALWEGARYAVNDGEENRLEDSAFLFRGEPS